MALMMGRVTMSNKIEQGSDFIEWIKKELGLPDEKVTQLVITAKSSGPLVVEVTKFVDSEKANIAGKLQDA